MTNFVDIEEIALAGTGEPGMSLVVLRSEYRYFLMSIPMQQAEQLHNIYSGESESLGNSFARGVLDMAGERIQDYSIDELVRTGEAGGYFNATLSLSDSVIRPVQPSVGLQFALMCPAKVRVKRDYTKFIPEQPPSRIGFYKVSSAKPKKLQEPELDRKCYEGWNFWDFAAKHYGHGPVSLQSGYKIPVYRKDDVVCAINMEDSETLAGSIQHKLDMERGAQKKKKGAAHAAVPRYSYPGIIERIIAERKVEVLGVYADGDMRGRKPSCTFIPERAFVELKSGSKTALLEAPVGTALPLGIRHLKSLMIKKPEPLQ